MLLDVFCLDILISQITNIVNKSLSMGAFSRSMKAALLKSSIKTAVWNVIF